MIEKKSIFVRGKKDCNVFVHCILLHDLQFLVQMHEANTPLDTSCVIRLIDGCFSSIICHSKIGPHGLRRPLEFSQSSK